LCRPSLKGDGFSPGEERGKKKGGDQVAAQKKGKKTTRKHEDMFPLNARAGRPFWSFDSGKGKGQERETRKEEGESFFFGKEGLVCPTRFIGGGGRKRRLDVPLTPS